MKHIKRFTFVALLLCCCLALNGFAAVPKKPAVPDENKVLAARFENILNHNLVYDDEIYSAEALINAATQILCGYADEDNFIEEDIVKAFIYDLYGVEVDCRGGMREYFPQKEGYVYLIPCGADIYNHTVISIQKNGDEYTVVSRLVIEYHCCETEELLATTKFIAAPTSPFGFNIVYSQLSPIGVSSL